MRPFHSSLADKTSAELHNHLWEVKESLPRNVWECTSHVFGNVICRKRGNGLYRDSVTLNKIPLPLAKGLWHNAVGGMIVKRLCSLPS